MTDTEREQHPIARRVRMRLRRYDGRIFLDRWGVEAEKLGGIFVHKMSAPDPGFDLHDHPWWFASLIIAGGYTEERAPSRRAPRLAELHEAFPEIIAGGYTEERRRWSVRFLRLDEAHRIVDLDGRVCWTIVVHGPNVRRWGFFLPTGWVDEYTYDQTVRAERRDLWNEPV